MPCARTEKIINGLSTVHTECTLACEIQAPTAAEKSVCDSSAGKRDGRFESERSWSENETWVQLLFYKRSQTKCACVCVCEPCACVLLRSSLILRYNSMRSLRRARIHTRARAHGHRWSSLCAFPFNRFICFFVQCTANTHRGEPVCRCESDPYKIIK